MAREAGMRPATTPSTVRSDAASMAVPKGTWKAALRMPSSVIPISTPARMSTLRTMPPMPATSVSTMLSEMIWPRIWRGVAPMARRMPISVVRSFTLTIMMLDTPMTPASSVPRPMSQTRKLMPLNRLSTMPKMSWVLSRNRACSSVGSK